MPDNMNQYHKTFLVLSETDLHSSSQFFAAAHHKILMHFSGLGHQ